MRSHFNGISIAVCAALCMTFLAAEGNAQRARLFGGLKIWYANWDLQMTRYEGVQQTDYSAALMAGPYVTLRLGDLTVSGSVGTSVEHFKSESRNPGLYYTGFNANRFLLRTDVNMIAALSLTPEFGIFGTLKYLQYTIRDATVYINGHKTREESVLYALGAGGGAQATVSFYEDSPFYSFLSVGGVLNSFNVKVVDDSSTELMYFLESGIGYMVPGSALVVLAGIRGEAGSQTQTILGPILAISYRFL